MHDSKLIQLLKTLEARQLSRLEIYLDSPYFNKNTDILSFFQYLRRFAPRWTDRGLAKAQVLKKVKWSKQTGEKELSYHMSDLLKQTEQFLTHEALEQDDWQQYLYLAEEHHQAGLSLHLRSVLDRAAKTLQKYPFRNADYYRRHFDWKWLLHRQTDPDQRTHNPALQEAADALDLFYLIEKLRYCCLMINAQHSLNIRYELRQVEAVLKMSAEPPWGALPAVQVYRTFLQLLREHEDTEAYFSAKALILEHEALFDLPEKETFFIGLFNFCSRRINVHNDEFFYREYLDSGRRLIESGVALADGNLSPWLYKNLVTVGLKTQDFPWVWKFLHRFRDQLPEAYRDPIYQYNLAHYHYYRREYDQAQRLLATLDFREVFMAMSTRNLLVKIYYETGQTELLHSLLEAYRIYTLRNSAITERNRNQVHRFIDLTRKMAKVEKWEAEKLEELLEQLPPASEVLHRDWLTEQLQLKMARFGMRKPPQTP